MFHVHGNILTLSVSAGSEHGAWWSGDGGRDGRRRGVGTATSQRGKHSGIYMFESKAAAFDIAYYITCFSLSCS